MHRDANEPDGPTQPGNDVACDALDVAATRGRLDAGHGMMLHEGR